MLGGDSPSESLGGPLTMYRVASVSGEQGWDSFLLLLALISVNLGLINLLLEKERGEFPDGLTGHPIDKIGYHGFLTWDLTFDGVRALPALAVDGQVKACGRALSPDDIKKLIG